MYLLIDLSLILLFAFAFAFSYFVLEWMFAISSKSLLNTKKYVIDIFKGTFLGGITLIIKLILMQIYSSFNIPLFFVVFVVLLIFSNITIASTSIVGPFLYYDFQTSYTDVSYLLIWLILIYGTVQITYSFFLKKKYIIYVDFSLLALMVFAALIFMGVQFDMSYNMYTIESSILIYPSVFILYFIMKTIKNISISANVLFESVNFAYPNYYRYSLAGSYIGKKIQERQINKGILGLFQIIIADKIDEYEMDEIRETVIKAFRDRVAEDSITYEYEALTFGYFIPLDDNLDIQFEEKNLEIIINDMQQVYKTENDNLIHVQIKSGYSLYGIQSYSIDELEENSKFAIDTSMDFSLRKFSPIHYRKSLIESKNLSLMDEAIDLNNFELKPIPLYNSKKRYLKMKFISVLSEYEYRIKQNFEDVLIATHWNKTFDRYQATESLNLVTKKDTIIFQFSPLAYDVIDYEDMKNKINKKDLDINKVIWFIPSRLVDDKSIKIIRKNIKNGFRMAIFIDEKNIPKSSFYNLFEYVIIKKFNVISQIKHKKIIFPFADSEKNLNSIPKIKGIIYGGEIS